MRLQGKRILFIASSYFGIAEKIEKKLREDGAIVDYYDERPDNSFLTKALIRINRNMIGWRINRYYNSIINETKERYYDYIFFIKAEAISANQVQLLLSMHPESKSIIYNWDSIARNRNALNVLKYFDKRYSFERSDCQKYDIEFLPLFYFDEYSDIPALSGHPEYKLFFAGTAHSDRYKIIMTLRDQCLTLNKKVYLYFYFQSRLMFWKYLVQHKEARHINKDMVHYSSLSDEQLRSLYRKSEIVADVGYTNQFGLSLRSLESLGAKRKLITTNADIVNYDFYNPRNILVIDRKNPVIPVEFLNSPYEPVPENIYRNYSLSNWIKNIFQ